MMGGKKLDSNNCYYSIRYVSGLCLCAIECPSDSNVHLNTTFFLFSVVIPSSVFPPKFDYY